MRFVTGFPQISHAAIISVKGMGLDSDRSDFKQIVPYVIEFEMHSWHVVKERALNDLIPIRLYSW